MRRILLLAALVIGMCTGAVSAQAGGSCTQMLMPVSQLKQVARGFGPIRGGMHTGVDLTAPYGSPVRAAAGGTVIFMGRYFGYGNMVDILMPGGTVTRYAHLSAFTRGMRVGSTVAVGGLIGAVGTSGHAHGPHLHFEVRLHGAAVDPKPFLALAPCAGGPPAAVIEEAHAPEPRQKHRPY